MSVHWQKILYYLCFSFLLSWGVFYLYFFFGGEKGTTGMTIMMTFYMIMPALSAILVQKVLFGAPLKDLGLFFHWDRWYWVSWGLPVAIAVSAFGVALLLPEVKYTPGMEGMYERFREQLSEEEFQQMRTAMKALPIPPSLLMLGQALIAGITINALFAFGEELGWRGLLYQQTIRYGFWTASFFTGLIWGIWHVPAILMGHNYPQHPVEGVFFMILFCLLWAPVFTFIRSRTGSVFPAAIMHGTINASAGLPLVYLKGGSDLTVGITGVSGLVVLGVLNFVLILYDKRKGGLMKPLSY